MPSILLLLFVLPSSGPVQAPVRTIQGIVMAAADSGVVLAGASVQIGKRTGTTDASGRFRIDSIPLGDHPVVIRRIGYKAARTTIPVYRESADFWEFYLTQAPFELPEEIVEAGRAGIFGTVSDPSQKPMAGATVELIGNGGGTVMTDSAGRFAFPKAVMGGYMVRARQSGFAERRLMFSVDRGTGKELSIALIPSGDRRISNADAAALFDLRRSLAFGLKRERMLGEELTRYGSLSVCEVPRVRAVIGTREVGILNGERQMFPGELCSWNMDEIAMIQFISTGSRRSRSASVVIWEKW
jgi:hypothetical protein